MHSMDNGTAYFAMAVNYVSKMFMKFLPQAAEARLNNSVFSFINAPYK